MPRFNPDLENTNVSTPIYEKGDYELLINAVRPFGYHAEAKDDKPERDVAGVTVFFKMKGRYNAKDQLEPFMVGEDVSPFKAYVHSEGAFRFTKAMLMAAMGYSKKEEKDFNKEWLGQNGTELWVEGQDDDVQMGAAWSKLEGQSIRATLDKREWQGEEQQEFKGFAPPSKPKK